MGRQNAAVSGAARGVSHAFFSFMGGTLYSTSVLKVSVRGPHAPELRLLRFTNGELHFKKHV